MLEISTPCTNSDCGDIAAAVADLALVYGLALELSLGAAFDDGLVSARERVAALLRVANANLASVQSRLPTI